MGPPPQWDLVRAFAFPDVLIKEGIASALNLFISACRQRRTENTAARTCARISPYGGFLRARSKQARESPACERGSTMQLLASVMHSACQVLPADNGLDQRFRRVER